MLNEVFAPLIGTWSMFARSSLLVNQPSQIQWMEISLKCAIILEIESWYYLWFSLILGCTDLVWTFRANEFSSGSAFCRKVKVIFVSVGKRNFPIGSREVYMPSGIKSIWSRALMLCWWNSSCATKRADAHVQSFDATHSKGADLVQTLVQTSRGFLGETSRRVKCILKPAGLD